MKKTYIAPELKVKNVGAESMLATSGEEYSLHTGGTVDGADGALGREYNNTPSSSNLWDQGW